MIKFWLLPTIALTLICALPILAIRAQPYDDHAIRELLADDCPAPCLLGIRPGFNTLSEGVYFLEAHDWVATRVDQMPSVVQMSVRYGAGIPRTEINWRWNPDPPTWINAAERGVLTVEDREVKLLSIDTHLTVGEILLAFGDPDVVWLTEGRRRRFEYSAWYADQHMFITTEGICPPRHVVHYPVRIRLYASSPRIAAAEGVVCH